MDEDKLFIHNLTRLRGTISAVSIDAMFDSLMYVAKNAVIEAQFVEENYLGCMFDDEEFLEEGKIFICSLTCVINRYEEAKRNSDVNFLALLRKKHRQARQFLDNDATKERIGQLIDLRYATIENRAIWATIVNIFGLLQHFPRTAVGHLLAPLIPQLTEAVPQIANAQSQEISRR